MLHDDGLLHATRSGISISPAVWSKLSLELKSFSERALEDEMLIIHKDLSVSLQKSKNLVHVILQRLFQKKDGTFQFMPESINLTLQQVANLCSSKKQITKELLHSLFTYTLKYYVEEEMDISSSTTRIPLPCMQNELYEKFVKVITDSFDETIPMVLECHGCRENLSNQLGHDCIMLTAQERCLSTLR